MGGEYLVTVLMKITKEWFIFRLYFNFKQESFQHHCCFIFFSLKDWDIKCQRWHYLFQLYILLVSTKKDNSILLYLSSRILELSLFVQYFQVKHSMCASFIQNAWYLYHFKMNISIFSLSWLLQFNCRQILEINILFIINKCCLRASVDPEMCCPKGKCGVNISYY